MLNGNRQPVNRGNRLTGYRFTCSKTRSQSEKPVIGKFLSFYYALIYW